MGVLSTFLADEYVNTYVVKCGGCPAAIKKMLSYFSFLKLQFHNISFFKKPTTQN
jgi:hypothetical protein